MQQNSAITIVSKTREDVAGISIAVMGFALAIYAYETHRMPSVKNVEAVDPSASVINLVALLVLVTFFFLYRSRPAFRLHRHPLVGILIAGSLTVAGVLLAEGSFVPETEMVDFFCKIVIRTCELLLLLCWAELLIPLGAKKVAVIFALSLIGLCGLGILTAFLKESVVSVIVATMPLLSIVCLYWFKDYNYTRNKYDPDKRVNAFENLKVETSLLPSSSDYAIKHSLYLVFLLPLMCYPIIFGHIHYSWVPAQDGSLVSLAVQLSAATGTLLGALLILFLVAYFWGRRKIQLYLLFVLPIVVLALYLTAATDSEFSFLYVIPLNISQKLAFLFIWLAPFLVPASKTPLSITVSALALYQLGKLIAVTMSSVTESMFYSIIVVITVIVLLGGIMVGILRDKSVFESDSLADIVEDDVTETSPDDRFVSACETIAKSYQLTRREEEVLQLLAEGLTAVAIAETLVISTSTAKTHIRNIYTKLNIHTQNELILLVHRNQSSA